jgi:hypothetical protein
MRDIKESDRAGFDKEPINFGLRSNSVCGAGFDQSSLTIGNDERMILRLCDRYTSFTNFEV